jgi:hypothetical protein
MSCLFVLARNPLPTLHCHLTNRHGISHFSFLSRKDRGYDLTTWDAVVIVFLDAGINDLPVTHIYGDDGEGPNKPSNSAAAITGSLLVEITPVTAGGGNNAGAEHADAPTLIASKTVNVTLTPGEWAPSVASAESVVDPYIA